MDNNNNFLPEIPEGKDVIQETPDFLKDDQWFDIDIEGDWLNVEDDYERPEWTLAYNGVPFAPLKGIHCLTGQPGHGKTMTFTQIMVAILKGKYGNLTYELSETHPNPSVLYIDTEMEKGNTQLVNLRVYSLMGWTYKIPHPEFRVLMLRETEKAEDRWRKTLKAIHTMRPTVCFIDGLLDVVSDFNDNVECQKIIYRCMKVASYYGISVWCLVHENPGSTKMVGHLGSMLERKVTDSFGTLKNKDPETGKVTFTVKQKKARGKDQEDWTFMVKDDNNKFGIPEQLTEETTPECLRFGVKSNYSYTEINRIMQTYIPNPQSMSQTALQDVIKKGESMGSNKAYNIIVDALTFRILERDSLTSKLHYIGHSLGPEGESPF